ncbi:hypothetical protein [Actinomadura sediminis]|uniref:Matrixin family metalloprotease n=1 Tax=Actinomadura sediminis TaxID=1038904 RepID=A0ABW3ELX1_9ACTN
MANRPPMAAARRLADRLWRVVVVALAAATAFALTPGAAQATPFPETWLADSRTHAYCFIESSGSNPWWHSQKEAVEYAMVEQLEKPTDMVAKRESCASGTDVWWWKRDLGPGVRGEAQCMTWVSGNRCDSADIRLDFAELDKGGNDWHDRRKTAVHELGHTVGLGHHSPGAHDCAMMSGEVPNTDVTWRRFHPHDRYHINQTY